MDNRSKVECVLCKKCEETKVTGALSTKDEVTAHQNCLVNIHIVSFQRETPASCSRTCKPFSGIGNERLFVLTRVSVFGSFQLFSSGLVCSSSPQFDDLFGFSVGDVLAEVKRGSKLVKLLDTTCTFIDVFVHNKSHRDGARVCRMPAVSRATWRKSAWWDVFHSSACTAMLLGALFDGRVDSSM